MIKIVSARILTLSALVPNCSWAAALPDCVMAPFADVTMGAMATENKRMDTLVHYLACIHVSEKEEGGMESGRQGEREGGREGEDGTEREGGGGGREREREREGAGTSIHTYP